MPRRIPQPPPERMAAMGAELLVLQALEDRARLDKYVHVSRAYDAGMTVREIARALKVAPDTAAVWKDKGEQERERRRRENSV